MSKITMKDVAKRADEIFSERFNISDILKMNVMEARAICMEEALLELTNKA